MQSYMLRNDSLSQMWFFLEGGRFIMVAGAETDRLDWEFHVSVQKCGTCVWGQLKS